MNAILYRELESFLNNPYSQFRALAIMSGTVLQTWRTLFHLISVSWLLEFPFYI